MGNKILCCLLLFLFASFGFCTQQYIVANQAESSPYTTRPGPMPGPMNIYAPPQQQPGYNVNNNPPTNQPQTNNPNQPPENYYQPKKQDWWEHQHQSPQRPVTPKPLLQQQPTSSQPQYQQQPTSPQPQYQQQPTPPSQNQDYNNQQQWMQNCINSVKDSRVAAYAQKYCECGWRHISSGELPLKLLISSNSASAIKEINTRLRVIKEECEAEIVGDQGTSNR